MGIFQGFPRAVGTVVKRSFSTVSMARHFHSFATRDVAERAGFSLLCFSCGLARGHFFLAAHSAQQLLFRFLHLLGELRV